jgi:hypothetical protein
MLILLIFEFYIYRSPIVIVQGVVISGLYLDEEVVVLHDTCLYVSIDRINLCRLGYIVVQIYLYMGSHANTVDV